jgi:hypothetical protein
MNCWLKLVCEPKVSQAFDSERSRPRRTTVPSRPVPILDGLSYQYCSFGASFLSILTVTKVSMNVVVLFRAVFTDPNDLGSANLLIAATRIYPFVK